MMGILVLVLFALLVFSIYHEARSLLNPFLLLAFLMTAYLAAGDFFYRHSLHTAYGIFLLILTALPLLIFWAALFLIYNGLVLLHKEGFSKLNLASLLLGILINIFFFLIYIRFSKPFHFAQPTFFDFLYAVGMFSFLIFGISFVAFMLYSILYLMIPKNKHYDYIIIHGAGLLDGNQVTPLLKRRIDKALEAFRKSKNPQVKLIASGGLGPKETISEAQAIANYIKEQASDIPKDRLLLEEQSHSTYENLLFSKQLAQKEMKAPRFLFVTNAYHVFRTSVYARRLHMAGDGLGCSTAPYYIPSAFIREFIAIVVYLKWLFIILYAWLIVSLFHIFFK
ncbi:YdcF family protein [Streptococcus macacae]|uniref:Membrane protein n=1 Tax=Streptococcus macacae NCTC 11558 TaxID=764298 RepID=G5JW34_9STRE|nr:YdcF family protein [Streptococcus macacae]EHJ52206.1 putative membrane protein [Streptococcus macacae NCTC 11558]SUN79370.1 GdmH [Streptococcus macacae NCTC 11558]